MSTDAFATSQVAMLLAHSVAPTTLSGGGLERFVRTTPRPLMTSDDRDDHLMTADGIERFVKTPRSPSDS